MTGFLLAAAALLVVALVVLLRPLLRIVATNEPRPTRRNCAAQFRV